MLWLYRGSQRNIDEIFSWWNIQAWIWIMSEKNYGLFTANLKKYTCTYRAFVRLWKPWYMYIYTCTWKGNSGMILPCILIGPKSGLRISHSSPWKSKFWSERRTVFFTGHWFCTDLVAQAQKEPFLLWTSFNTLWHQLKQSFEVQKNHG